MAKLPIVMAFENDRENGQYKIASRMSNHRYSMNPSSRSMPAGYSLVSDPVYSQIGEVMGQLQTPANTGLESLLHSKSKLDQMKEDFSQRAGLPEDAYYYYYYDEDDDKNFVSNDLEDVTNEPVGDNFAVEHGRQEIMVLPDGSPLPGTFTLTSNMNTETPTPGSSQDRYFHLGMIDDEAAAIRELESDPKYPTPTYYEPATSAPVNLLNPKHSVASIVMYDPMSYKGGETVYQTFEKPTTLQFDIEEKTTKPSPAQISLDDLTTLSSINPDDEYTLKHDGVQWLFLKNDDRITESPTVLSSSSKVILPHDVKITSGPVTAEESAKSKPHLVFKHPSGTVTEMHIDPTEDSNSKEKIITVIETGPVTQNYTKIKIKDISELDKVIENVFNIVSESSEKYDSHREPISSYPKKTPQATTIFAIPKKNHRDEQSSILMASDIGSENRYTPFNRVASKPIPTRIIQRLTTMNDEPTMTSMPEVQFTNINSIPTSRPHVIRITKVPETTRYTKTPSVTRFSTLPGSTRLTSRPGTTRFTKKPENIRFSTPAAETTQTAKVSQRPKIRLTTTQVRPGLKRVTISAPPGTVLPEDIQQALQNERLRPQPVTEIEEVEEEEIVPETQSTAVTTYADLFDRKTTADPFTTMINNLQTKPAEPETFEPRPTTVKTPMFTISTTTDGVVSTKTYTTVEEALKDLQKITTVDQEETTPSYPTSPFTRQQGSKSTPITSAPTLVTSSSFTQESPVDEVTIVDNEPCDTSFLKVNDIKVCDALIRSEPVREEAKREYIMISLNFRPPFA